MTSRTPYYGAAFELNPGILTPVPGKANYFTLTRRGLKNSLYDEEDCPKCGVTATTKSARLPHTRVPRPGTRAGRHWNQRTEFLFQPILSCPEFRSKSSAGATSSRETPRSLPEPKCQCSIKTNPLHQMHHKSQQQTKLFQHQEQMYGQQQPNRASLQKKVSFYLDQAIPMPQQHHALRARQAHKALGRNRTSVRI